MTVESAAKVETFTLPATAAEADTLGHSLGVLATATEWKRAAVVHARVTVQDRRGRPNGQIIKNDLLTPDDYAALGIHGLRSATTVRRYWRAWQRAVDDGLTVPACLGGTVELSTADWGDYYTDTPDPDPDNQVSVTGSVLAADLHRIVHNALLFAGRDDTAAATNLIRIECVGGDIVGIGCTRRALGVTRYGYTGTAAVIQLTRDAADKLVVATKPYKPPHPVLISVTDATVAFRLTDGNTIEFPNYIDPGGNTDLAYPDWRALIPELTDNNGESESDESESEDYRHVNIQPELLGLLPKVLADDYTPITLHPGARRLTITIGESFKGVLVAAQGQPFQRPGWL